MFWYKVYIEIDSYMLLLDFGMKSALTQTMLRGL